MSHDKWGLRPGPGDGHPVFTWGARAIYYQDTASFDLVHDRQTCEGGLTFHREELLRWLDTHGLPALRKLVARERPSAGGQELLQIREDGFVLRANPQRSHGYLYLGAWKVSESPT
jgi:hypothetical protein